MNLVIVEPVLFVLHINTFVLIDCIFYIYNSYFLCVERKKIYDILTSASSHLTVGIFQISFI